MENIIYTDGSCLGNPGRGGWGIVFPDGQEISGGFRLTTNNRMEVLAAIVALEKTSGDVEIVSDSQYLVNAINKGWLANWKRNGWRSSTGKVKNQDLWQRLDIALANRKVAFRWVRGHAGHIHNERVDVLARMAASGSGLPEDEGYQA